MRRSDIQGLRAVAVLLVVAFHAGLPLPGGFIGVDVFFVISGFVITGLLLRQWSASGRIDFREFYVRRTRRLLPALALLVSVTVAASFLLQSPNGAQQETAKTALGAMLISANVIIPRLVSDYFARAAGENPLLHTWSLSAEEQFYLVFPFLLAAGLAMQGRSRRLAGAALVIGAVSVFSFLAPPGFYSSIARAWEFGAGALVALAATWIRRLRPSLLITAGVTGLIAVIASAALITPGMRAPGSVLLPTIIGTACVLASGAGQAHLLSRGLGARALVWIGDRSYSWYLWHWPAIVFGRLLFPQAVWVPACGAALSLIPAALSFRYVEHPIRFAPNLRDGRLVALMSVVFAMPMALAAGVSVGARTGWGLDWAYASHAVVAIKCDSGPFDPVRCRWTAPAATRTVLLVGDSQAWAIADGLIPAATSLGFDTIVGSHNACAFGSPQITTSTLPAPRFLLPTCLERNAAILQYAVTHRPGVAVIANQSVAYASEYPDLWRRNMSGAVARLRAAGWGVVVVAVVPLADERSVHLSMLRRSVDRFTSLTDRLNVRRDADAADRFAADENPGTVVFDPAAVLCHEDRCLVAQGGTELYSDQNHLSRPGALRLESALHALLERVMATVQVR